jgi:hypothetical protein
MSRPMPAEQLAGWLEKWQPPIALAAAPAALAE